ncbi:MAG: hypothetical protein ACI4AQ_05615 [Lachnospiraceae bacterium]
MARKKRINVCAMIEFAMIVMGIIYVIVCTALKLHQQWIYRLIFAGWVAIYMVLNDLVEPVVTDRFRRKAKKQVNAYYKFAILDMIGIAGLLWFVVMAGMLEDYTHYAGIAIFAVCYGPRTIFYKKFNTRVPYSERVEENLDDEFEIDIND